jgi:hypothetical protein
VAWSVPRTWVATETVTAVLMNGHIRDQLRELWRILATVTLSSASANNTVIGNTGALTLSGNPLWIEASGKLTSAVGLVNSVQARFDATSGLDGTLIATLLEVEGAAGVRGNGAVQYDPASGSHNILFAYTQTGSTTGYGGGTATIWEKGGA